MERRHSNIERPTDEYDHELTQTQADAIMLADELLKHKLEGSSLTFVDIVLQGDQNAMLVDIEQGPLAYLLAASNEQLAIESDGSYYPKLDIRKQDAEFTGMSLRVWGWEDKKFRYKNRDDKTPPYELQKYPGQIDKARQLEISMGYSVGKIYASENLSLYVGSARRGHISASSKISMAAYAEMGYEGHGGKHDNSISNESAEWFLDFIARNVGDEPKSYDDVINERIVEVRELARCKGALDGIDRLIEETWNAQALYFMRLPLTLLDGKSILQYLNSEDPAGGDLTDVTAVILESWKAGNLQEYIARRQDGSGDRDE